MKLNEVRPYLESAGELDEKFFGIQDQGMLFDILRKKMYSNPILAICREISCNARDAHREVGAADVPIQIHLPSNVEPYYKIKDFGPGISPDRMANVFIKYTASTKREDNVQTGGFGLGAKTPFSYSDAFSIITVHNGIRYNYNCVIDETRVGKLILTSETPTNEKNGTEIMIPVLPKNFNDFRVYTEQACRHWDVKPTIKGGQIDWQKQTPVLSGDGWCVVASNRNYYDTNHEAKIIIDGIEYPLDLSALRNYADAKLIDAARGTITMYFGIGELSLSASREQIYLDEKTQTIIRNRLDAIGLEIKKRAEEKIATFTNLWDANVYYNKELHSSFNNIDFLGTLQWRGISLVRSHFMTPSTSFQFKKGKHSRKYGTDPNKLSRSSTTYIGFEDKVQLYFNDLPLKEPTPKHVKKAFDDNADLKTVYVINPTDKLTKDDLFKKYHLEEMGVKLLSTITKANARAYTPAASRLLLFKFDSRASAFRQVSYASIEEDSNAKVLCTLHRDAYNGIRNAVLKNKEVLSFNSLKTLLTKFPNTSFYGVDDSAPADRIKEDFSDFEEVEAFISDKVFADKQISYTKIKFANHNRYSVDDKMLRITQHLSPLVKDATSLYFKCIDLHKRIKELSTNDLGLLHIYESINGEIDEAQMKKFAKDNPDLDIHGMNKRFEKFYPLLQHLNKYNYDDIVSHLAEYINLIDSERNKKNV